MVQTSFNLVGKEKGKGKVRRWVGRECENVRVCVGVRVRVRESDR